jgi:hypothetical protein
VPDPTAAKGEGLNRIERGWREGLMGVALDFETIVAFICAIHPVGCAMAAL